MRDGAHSHPRVWNRSAYDITNISALREPEHRLFVTRASNTNSASGMVPARESQSSAQAQGRHAPRLLRYGPLAGETGYLRRRWRTPRPRRRQARGTTRSVPPRTRRRCPPACSALALAADGEFADGVGVIGVDCGLPAVLRRLRGTDCSSEQRVFVILAPESRASTLTTPSAIVKSAEIESKLRELAAKYAQQLSRVTGVRMAAMTDDDTSHFLVYRVLGVGHEEGRLIDQYQNKGRFLYKYAGALLEESAKLCLQERFPDAKSLRLPNSLGKSPKNSRSIALSRMMRSRSSGETRPPTETTS